MNFTYFKFLCATTIKKRPIWITWLLYLLTCISFLIILPAVARANTLQVWANTTMAVCQTFLGMTVALFTAVLGIHIFKDGLEEGTELVVISKPISRVKIVLTKFFVFGLFCLMVNATSLIVTVLTIFLPTTEIKFYWGLIVSMFVGNLICFGVFGSIAILLTVKFAKIGVIITNILISLVFLIYQCLTLFVFQIPIRSLSDNHVKAPSYIIADRNTETGEYTEKEVVEFNTDWAKQLTLPSEKRNYSVSWQDTKKYWTDVICKDDPTPMLNYTDLAGQISLTYLSVGIDQYAYRQGHRFFAISRFYTYDLNSPASPEIITGVENKQSLPWVYADQYQNNFYDEKGKIVYYFSYPSKIGFSGIAPLGTTRLRGYGDQLPIGFYVRSGEALSSKDVYFEPAEWRKYSKPFNLICDHLFDYDLYKQYITDEKIITDPGMWPSAWASNNKTLERYYSLLWSCFTGNSAKVEYFNNDFLKDYSADYFDIHSVNDLNERFLQFKYFIFFRAYEEQQKIINQPATSEIELEAKELAAATTDQQLVEYLLNIKHLDKNWMMQVNDPEQFSFLEPGTQTLYTQLIYRTHDVLSEITSQMYQDNDIDLATKEEILSNSTKAKLLKTQKMFNTIAYTKEDFLYNSLEKPSRSAAYHGKAYAVTDDWVPYYETQYTHNGQNMKWFFYTSKETIHFWIYAVAWGIIAFSLFAAGAIVYNKYDVK